MSAAFTNTAGSVTYADTGSFGTTGKWRDGSEGGQKIDGPEYGYDFPATAGVAGTGTVAYGYRGQKISMSVIYVNTSMDAVLSAVQADLVILGSYPSTLVLDGQTYRACTLDAGASGMAGYVKSTGAGKYWVQVKVAVTAHRNAA